uniref:JmjC domain-containing protein 7-like n=1 Tax=Saccoglossus kowalevskii TaxID=10224 RepID=A0ABM0MJ69_SACKO|nr:PREDICTED: jmjC domain-containing protein 7-like [Saccoglossus kowalevskii]
MKTITLLVLFACINFISTESEDGFLKGHLKPLGGHRPPDVPIDETDIPPHPRTFWEKYVKHGKPLILRGAMKHSPGFNLWTTQYLKEKYGDLEVRLEGKIEKASNIPIGAKSFGRDTIANFINTYQSENKYIVSQLPTAMYPEVMVPPTMQCGTFKDSLVEIDIWMSSGNSKSALHKDAFNTWNCLVSGTKQWKMVENKYEPLIYRSWEPEAQIGGFSLINVSSVDMIKHPNIAKVRWSNFTITAGDCLYLPRSYYHQVTSFGDPNIAVALLFSRMTDFDDTGCDNAELKYTPLSDMIVTWNWSGHGTMTMGHADHRAVKEQLLKAAESYGRVTVQNLAEETLLIDPEKTFNEALREMITPFEILDKEGKGYLSREDILNLDIYIA